MALPLVLLGLLLTALVPQPAAAEASSQLTRYPYLTDAVGTYVTVNWATDRSVTTAASRWGVVDSGTGACTPTANVPASRVNISVNGVLQYQWKSTFSVGSAGKFCYRVYRGDGFDLLGTDETPIARPQVPAGSAESYSFAVLGDTGEVDSTGANAAQARVMSQVAASGARFVVQVGDFGHPHNTQKNFGDLLQKGAGLSAVFGPDFWKGVGATKPTFAVPGNHGVNNDSLLVNFPQSRAASTSGGSYAMVEYCCLNDTVRQNQQSAWYAFDAGNARYYMLTAAWADGNVGSLTGTNRSLKLYKNDYDNHWAPGKAEYEWLRADLEQHADTAVKMAFFHFPLYSDQATETSDVYLQGADSLEGLLGRHGVDLAFNGHAHLYQRNAASPQGVVSYLTGAGGADVQTIGSRCSAIDAYGIGWSDSNGTGNKCGAATTPTSPAEVHHFLLVTVNNTEVTVTPVNSLGQSFDVQTYDFSPSSPGDDTPPGAPTELRASTTSTPSVNLTWQEAQDNVGVTDYAVYRGDELLATVSGTSANDTTVAAGGTYHYTVRARDAAGNVSAASNTATVAIPTAQPAELTFGASDDAKVSAANASTNYGTLTTLSADGNPSAQVESYLTFTVAGVKDPPASATLRLWTTTTSTSATTDGPGLYRVPDTSWSEGTITWDNKPAAGGTAIDNLGGYGFDTMVEYDVRSVVNGDGTYSFKLSPDSTDGTSFYSRQGPAGKRPQLVITSN